MRQTVCSLVLGCAMLASAPVFAAIGSIHAFGDSLTDQGNVAAAGIFEPMPYTNLVPGGAYPSGTFSDGQVWVQMLAGTLGLPLTPSALGGTNYAIGGAKTGFLPAIGFTSLGPTDVFPVFDPLLGQANFAAGLPGGAPADGLYLINGGGNDIRQALGFVLGGGSQANALTAMSEAVDNLMGAVSVLAGAGATRFGVSNVPDVSLTPAIKATDAVIPGTAAFVNMLVMEFNAALATALPVTQAANPGISITLLDSFGLTNGILGDPLAFGFTNTMDPCTLQNAGAGCVDPDSFVFWDGLHPTSAVHQLSADATLAAIVPIPAAVWMFAAGVVALAGMSRRRAPY